jgi:hypothetical protein
MAENLEQSSIRELSLEETEAVSGGFAFGPELLLGTALLAIGAVGRYAGKKISAAIIRKPFANGGGAHAKELPRHTIRGSAETVGPDEDATGAGIGEGLIAGAGSHGWVAD